LSATLVARPASKIQEGVKAFNCPGHGTSFGKAASFRRVPSKQGPPKGSFLNFLSSDSGCRKNACAETGAYPTGRPYCCAYSSARPRILTQSLVIPNGFIVRNLLSLAALPHSLPECFSRCGKHLEILWEAMIDGIYTATYACKVSRTVGFALVAFPPGLNSRRLGGPRFGL